MTGGANKALAAAFMAVLIGLDQAWGVGFGPVSAAWVTVILAFLTPVFVWLIPNRQEHPLAR